MERQFNNGDFEKLLRDNANQYRMYPSEKVWKGINSALHTRRRWYGITAGLMLLITSTLVTFFIINNNSSTNPLSKGDTDQTKIDPNKNIVAKNSTNNKVFTPAITNSSTTNKPLTSIGEIYLNNKPDHKLKADFENIKPILESQNITNETTSSLTTEIVSLNDDVEYKPEEEILTPAISPLTESQVLQIESGELKEITGQIKNPGTLDEETNRSIQEKIAELASQRIQFNKPAKTARLTGQFFFTPTISYRKLTENKKVYSGNSLSYIYTIDINNLVQHKPAMGLEFGFETKYRLNDKFNLKGGLQFNINRYDIRAYSHTTEIATVAINNNFGVDSMASLSNFRNFNGDSPNWLENFYFQVAFPIGAEIILTENKNIGWGISGTVQPTYVIGDRAYVISSDYKNYAKFPNLMRRWNISTGVSTFVNYSSGRLKWQVGPHVRYQHLSSFVSALSTKENLFAVGLRVGMTINPKK